MISPWPRVRLGEVLHQVERIHPIDPTQTYRLLGARWYAQGLFVREEKLGAEIAATRVYSVQPGDFIYNRLFAWKGAFAVAGNESVGAHVSNEFPAFVADPSRLDTRFLLWTFHQQRTWAAALRLSTGATPTSRNRLKEAAFLAMEIPLPPLAEQRRIVRCIEKVATRVEEANSLRQASVRQAEAVFASRAGALFMANLKRWPLRRLGDVGEVRSGVTLGRKLHGHTIRRPYLRVANVQDGHLNLSEIKEVEILEDEADKWLLQHGDLLLTEGGDWDKLGRGTVWRNEILDCIHQNHIFRVRTNPDEFVPEFLAALIASPVGKAYFQGASKQTTNLASINQRQLKNFRVLQPPLAEQRRVVAELDALGARVDGLRQLQAATDGELSALVSSVLDRAFSGGL